MADTPLRWGIVGCGVIAPWHAKAITHSDGIELSAVCDIVPENTRTFAEDFGVDTVFGDYQEMFSQAGLDVVSICAPSGIHSEIAVAAAGAGVNVLTEKPMAITLPQIDAMISACDDAGVKLGCIFQRRTTSASIRVREAVKNGELGKMVMGDAYLKYYRSQAYYDSAGWRGTWELDGGGALMNQGVHGIDLLLWIMGDVEKVYAKAAPKTRRIPVEDTAVAILTFKSGAWGVLEGTTSCNPGEATRLELHGENGTVILEDPTIKRWAVTSEEDGHAENVELEIEEDEAPDAMAGDPQAFGLRGHVIQVRDMADAIRNDRQPLVPGTSARKAVELILAVYRSSELGWEVTLPLDE
jgi:predicted dehydrogenase